MKRFITVFVLLTSISTFAAGYEVVKKSNGDRYFVNTCLGKLTDQRANDLCYAGEVYGYDVLKYIVKSSLY